MNETKYNQLISDKRNLMGPNVIRMLNEITSRVPLANGMRVLDLGCGTGLSSIYLAHQYDIQIYATDLWISATENYRRIRNVEAEDQIIPIHADANCLPYADEFFDAVVSMDAYHYFGRERGFFSQKLLPLLKPGGIFLFGVPGFKWELHDNPPKELLLSWGDEDLTTMHSCAWWHNLLTEEGSINNLSIFELDCFEQAWGDWLNCDNTYAVTDRAAMNAGAGQYMNLIGITGQQAR